MAEDTQTRKLATIVALDVAGYSARTEADEARTTAEVAALRKVIEAIAAKHAGRVFNTAGDGFMLEFGSSLAAVEAAFELAETCEPQVRVGVHLGDVVVQPNGDLLGHGVNVAARLMARSDPGSALVSGAVRQTIRGPTAQRLQSRGMLKLDKMAEAIEAFALTAVMSTTAVPDVFLSYAREDQPSARLFAEAFQRAGLTVWWDITLRSGDAYDEVMEAALKAAKAVVVLWSKRSVESRWVRAEATNADRNKTLVPCMIEPCERPIMFELTQTAELNHWKGDASDKAWQAFLADVKRTVTKGVPVVASLTPAANPMASSAPPKPGVRGEAPTLAVLPFANRSGQADDEVFALGIVEDVIDALSQNSAVNVLASSATARFRTGALPDLEAMARDLGVRYVLEGNVRRTGASLRVTAQLVEPATGRIVWTQKFDRPLSELAAMQEQLVVEVAAQLDANVNRLEIERALRKPNDLTAWEAVMRAQSAYIQYTPESLEHAADLAARAVAIDPNYGLGHGILALTQAMMYNFMTPDDPGETSRIRDIIERALKLDPANGMVLAYAAQALCFIGEPSLALAHAENAVRKSTNSTMAAVALGQALVLLNRLDQGVEAIDKACQFTKGSNGYLLGSYGWKGIALMRAGRWAEAEAVEDELLSFNPMLNFGLMHKAILRQRTDDRDDARAFVRNVRAADPGIALATWELRMSRWHAGSPTRDIILENLRAAWRLTEASA